MSDTKTILPAPQYVQLYSEISEFVLDRIFVGEIYNDDGSLTPDAQEVFIEIADRVDAIMSDAGLRNEMDEYEEIIRGDEC